MKIDCDTCVVRGESCADCVVSFLSVPVAGGARLHLGSANVGSANVVELDAAQARAIARFAAAGLVAPLRHLA